jgi:hypothetical protein
MGKPVDETLSIEVARLIKSSAKSCFENAYKASLAFKKITEIVEEVSYVQGFLAMAGDPFRPIEYSWLELSDRIIDPTLPHLDKTAQALHYFPAHSLSVQELTKAVETAREDYPEDEALPVYGKEPYEYYGDIMLGGVDYLIAFKAAEAKCRELNKPKLN